MNSAAKHVTPGLVVAYSLVLPTELVRIRS